MLLKLIRIGYDITDVKGFTIDRPKGSKDFLFLHFKTPVQIRFNNGKLMQTQPGDCIVFTPDYPQWFHSPDHELKTDWVHFTGDESHIYELIKKLQLPLNTLLQPAHRAFINRIFLQIRSELVIDSHYRPVLVSGLLLQFLAQLARSIQQESLTHMSPYKRATLEKFKSIRMQALNHPEYKWTTAQLAEKAQLSETRFSALYKEFFHISPKQDLIRMRLEKAQYLLMNKAISVQEVAEQSGYENQFHFIRQFKKYVGCTPGQYYKD